MQLIKLVTGLAAKREKASKLVDNSPSNWLKTGSQEPKFTSQQRRLSAKISSSQNVSTVIATSPTCLMYRLRYGLRPAHPQVKTWPPALNLVALKEQGNKNKMLLRHLLCLHWHADVCFYIQGPLDGPQHLGI